MKQQTLKSAIKISGVGLHSGEEATVTVVPAAENAGIGFYRSDLGVHIPLHAGAVQKTQLCSVIQNDAGQNTSTVEHLFSALIGLGIDNACIDINGPEVPILDGSAQQWVAAIEEAGITAQSTDRNYLEVKEKVEVIDGERIARAAPYDGFQIEVHVDFNHPAVPHGNMVYDVDPVTYVTEIAPARTFCLKRDIDMMRKAGLIKGGSLDCACVFGDEGPLNPEGLRFEDEPIRHKILDVMGDLFVAGKPLKGKFYFKYPGHGLNNQLLRKIS